MITPGTRLHWRTLADWLACADQIDRRRTSQRRYDTIKRHWQALPVELIRTADKASTMELISFLDNSRGGSQAWARPPHGKRRNTLWELYNVEARNRLSRLLKADDETSLDLGHNSIATRTAPDP